MNTAKDDERYMQRALDLANHSARKGTGPFGCVIVKDGKIVGEGSNRVTKKHDPTAHAEIVAIRAAAKKLRSFDLSECVVYTSTYPCPMCLGALYWARPAAMFYSNTAKEAARIGFDDAFIYEEIGKSDSKKKLPIKRLKSRHSLEAYKLWKNNPRAQKY